MDITSIGPWALLALGIVVVLGALWLSVKGRQFKLILPAWIFGMALSGIGVYGPAFLKPYGEFLEPILSMMESPGTETYSAFFNDVAEGKMPEPYQNLGLSYALNNPIEHMDSILEDAEKKAPTESSKVPLTNARADLEARALASATLVDETSFRRTAPTRPSRFFDRKTQSNAARTLLALPDSTLRGLNLDRARLRALQNPH